MSTVPRPLVSVVMPVLNPHPLYFRQAVRSVLTQSFTDFELVIIEDPSPRSAGEVLAEMADPRIRHFLNPRRTSLVDQLNRGLAEARGELVARFDADDICEPKRFENQVAFLQAHLECGVVGTQLRIIDTEGTERGGRFYPQDHAAIIAAMARFNPLAHPSVMYRRDLVMAAGGYQYRKYPANEDYELWSRLARRGVRFANLPEPLIRYRIHPEGMKSARLHGIIRGTLEVKQMHWRDRMDLAARARMYAELLLLLLPAPVVLRLFMRTQYHDAPANGDGQN